MMLEFLKKKFQKFHATIIEGHYDGHVHPARDLITEQDCSPSPEEKAGSLSFSLALMIAGDVVLGAFAALTSLTALGIAAGVIAAAGASFYAHEYYRCKKAATEKICETNLAGQHVEGTRTDLCRLHKMQERIVDLSVEFGSASAASLKTAVADEIARDTDAVTAEIRRVRVLDEGLHHAGKAAYAFVRPSLHVMKQA